jgi:hypothetical protein
MKELTPDFVRFIKKAHRECPSMFCKVSEPQEPADAKMIQALFTDLHAALLAWKRMKRMASSHQNWAEADYATNVYNVFRTPAIRRSAYRYVLETNPV